MLQGQKHPQKSRGKKKRGVCAICISDYKWTYQTKNSQGQCARPTVRPVQKNTLHTIFLCAGPRPTQSHILVPLLALMMLLNIKKGEGTLLLLCCKPTPTFLFYFIILFYFLEKKKGFVALGGSLLPFCVRCCRPGLICSRGVHSVGIPSRQCTCVPLFFSFLLRVPDFDQSRL